MSSLKQIIYDYSKHNTVLNDFYHALSRIRIQLSKHLSDENYLKRQFRKVFGYHLDLNNPKTFNEKLQWLKLHDRNPEYQKLVDKYEVRKYVKETIGEEYLVPLIGIYDDPEDIYFNKLPNQFVLKPTHTSGSVIICRDKNSLDLKQTKKTLAKWMQDNYYWRGREWPYKEVLPRIICEEIISTEDSSLPKDYKLFCFSGIPKVAFVASDRGMDTKFDFYDILWNKLPLSQHYPNSNLDMKKPLQWEEMIKLASKLSKQFPHVRVDFYIDANGYIKFGEMTFYHFSGFQVFEPREYDELFGSWIDLSLVEKNQKKDDNVRK